MTAHAFLTAKLAVFGVVNPGTGIQPPGTQGIVTALGYVSWIVCALCVAGVLMVAGRMALHHRQGIGGEHMSGLAWVLGACILVAAGSGVVGALI
jgi:cytochrome c oxidase assembly factor CtaG